MVVIGIGEVLLVIIRANGTHELGRKVALTLGDDIDALGTNGIVDIGELVSVHVNLTQGDLNVVLADATRCGGLAHQLLDNLSELVGKLDVGVLLLGCHLFPFDA